MRIARIVQIALLGAFLGACGIGDKMGDDCLVQRRANDQAYNKLNGMKTRGVRQGEPAYEVASEELGRARNALSRCEATAG